MSIKKLIALFILTIFLTIAIVSPAMAASYRYFRWTSHNNYINITSYDSASLNSYLTYWKSILRSQYKIAPKPAPAPVDKAAQYAQKVVELCNLERQKAGLQHLVLDSLLSKGATVKSQDMIDKKYFDHTSPTYGSPFDMMKSFGIQYMAAAENIAAGYSSPEAVVQGWMNSPGHRANILGAKFTKIGVGYAEGGNMKYCWTQWFTN